MTTTRRKVITTRCVFTLRVDVCMIRPQRPSIAPWLIAPTHCIHWIDEAFRQRHVHCDVTGTWRRVAPPTGRCAVPGSQWAMIYCEHAAAIDQGIYIPCYRLYNTVMVYSTRLWTVAARETTQPSLKLCCLFPSWLSLSSENNSCGIISVHSTLVCTYADLCSTDFVTLSETVT